MKYVCLVYLEEKTFAPMSQAELDAWVDRNRDHDDELRRTGHFVFASALQSPQAATTVRVRNGRLSATDGPFAETKEHLGGFLMIEARDLNEAIQLAGKLPFAELGSIEVRPVRELMPKT